MVKRSKEQDLEQELLSTEEIKVSQLEVEEDARNIYINDRAANLASKFKNNSISTSKYYALFFIPQNLLYQFCRVANLYFLLLSILQFIPGLSPTGRVTTIFPLSVILMINMAKELYEDLKRRAGDQVHNNRPVKILIGGEFETLKWKDVKVGDIVMVENNQLFPCDLVALSTSEPLGQCFVETCNLDGETNLKIKQVKPETNHLDDADKASSFFGSIQCEQPNNRLYKFEARLNSEDLTLPLDPDQLLLSGCTLKNTKWIIGVSIYTGHETKLMKNRNETPNKISKVELATNLLILLLLLVQALMCLGCAIGALVWNLTYRSSIWYIDFNKFKDDKSLANETIRNFFTFLILYGSLIPISLYASLEVAKAIQGFFISQDLHLFYPVNDTPATVRSSSLNEDLGQIQFVFSDKTGTLTCNKMDFMKFSVSSIAYGTGHTEIARSAARREKRELIEDRPTHVAYNSYCNFYDERINNGAWENQPNKESLCKFFILLAVCHTVIPDVDVTTGQIIYQASSPDENALVKAAKLLGVEFIEKTIDQMVIKIKEKKFTFRILAVLEFNSDRKRQSVLVRDEQDRIILMTKGADMMLFPLLKQKIDSQTVAQLEQFASDGLRTLICAQRIVSEQFYHEWIDIFNQAKCSLYDREERVSSACEQIETDLEFVGVTAIEDQLQDGVPDCISELAKAGIKVWVLTGDKQETAINIGFACDLLNDNMALLIVDQHEESKIKSNLTHLRSIANAAVHSPEQGELGLVINGDILATVMQNEILKNMFLELGIMCRSVICCRASPKQKADVVSLVKNNLHAMTLAIGDGANDVSMIQAAHIGVGISGEEGLQAANASDYCIAQFRFLKRLLLVHGRWNYRRMSKLVLYCFYKQFVLTTTQFLFNFVNGFTGTSVHERWSLSFYNLFFTSLPVLVLGIWDKDVQDVNALEYPEIYHQGHHNRFFNTGVFVANIANGIFHACVCFFIPMICFDAFQLNDGQSTDMLGLGLTIYTSLFFVVTIKVGLEMSRFSVLHFVAFFFSLCCWFVFVFVQGNIYAGWAQAGWVEFPFNESYSFLQEHRYLSEPRYWAIVALTVLVAVLRDYFYKCYVRLATRDLYYEVMHQAHKMVRKDIMDTFPLDEFIPKAVKPRSKKMNQIKELFNRLKVSKHRGYAFSQSEGEQRLVK
ncbi:phospholipid-transporting ATPase [Acrasis kona]|uniref:Phospholipid-transporting ATPase n=1 Tax=Acrasis kona TaxID=1008807 RepID=A0AAW2YI61_9EUKA